MSASNGVLNLNVTLYFFLYSSSVINVAKLTKYLASYILPEKLSELKTKKKQDFTP